MQALLDTHALIWWVLGDSGLSVPVRQTIADPANEIFVSAASGWEITTKYRLGRLPAAAQLATNFAKIILGQGFIPLPITVMHACMSGSLPGPHKDPFDRTLAAQSLAENMPILSNDTALDQFGVTRIW
ncbi:MAG TPA: type II toxin-antitoxin system VapC family toxin [Stellaceae bacterium]|nr:type II toxin-antitoxin system VapC family toxin [Stellaceae bacterium]